MQNYQVKSTADWRSTVRKNKTKTRWVIFSFILFFLLIGLLIDFTLVYTSTVDQNGMNVLSLSDVFFLFIHFKIPPIATIICSIIAVIWVICTFRYYDKIMLAGTNYKEVSDNAADPIEQRLYNVVQEMKIAANMAFMPRIFIIEANYLNAFASGYSDKSAMIAITRKLVDTLTRDELQAVVAHELTHIRNQDIKLNLFISTLSNMLVFMVEVAYFFALQSASSQAQNVSNDDSDNDQSKNGNGIIALFVIIASLRIILPFILSFLSLYLSRTREYMADAGAVELMRDNEPLAKALLKIQQSYDESQASKLQSLSNEQVRQASYIYNPYEKSISKKQNRRVRRKSFLSKLKDLSSTHPSLKSRLKAIGVIQKL
ncbi:zinc metalloprotease HtpX [Thiotrichales bacterium 19S3-7]|nr:zinc metalloprotease HtpX [Thiotrichales bacterium 19S3-7]MCF6801813.1 zinc metalloprotease HtpX [Thiotrichales bacterium 19S3-11]